MNAAQLAMITAYAQAQQIAGNWTFDAEGSYHWQHESRYYADFDLLFGDEGFELAIDNGDPVPVRSLSQLKALIAAHVATLA